MDTVINECTVYATTFNIFMSRKKSTVVVHIYPTLRSKILHLWDEIPTAGGVARKPGLRSLAGRSGSTGSLTRLHLLKEGGRVG